MRMEKVHGLLAGLIMAATAGLAGAQEPIPAPGYPGHPGVPQHVEGGCANCAPAPVHAPAPTAGGCETCGTAESHQGYYLRSICEGPCGGEPCDKPFGCTSKCDEKCFLFGSCRQFFGRRNLPPVAPPPGIIPPWTSPCEYGTWHRW